MKKNKFFFCLMPLLLAAALIMVSCPNSGEDNGEEDLDNLGSITIAGDRHNGAVFAGAVLTVDTSNLRGGTSPIDFWFVVEGEEEWPNYRPTGFFEVSEGDVGRHIWVYAQRIDWPDDEFVVSARVGPVQRGWVVETIATVDHGEVPFIGLRGLAIDENNMLYTVGRRGQVGNAFVWQIDPSQTRTVGGRQEAVVNFVPTQTLDGSTTATADAPTLAGAPRFLSIRGGWVYVPRMWYFFEVERWNIVTGQMQRISENILLRLRERYDTGEANGIGTAGNATIPAQQQTFHDNATQDIAVAADGRVFMTSGGYHGSSLLRITPAAPGSLQPGWDSTIEILAGGRVARNPNYTVPGIGQDARFHELDGITIGHDGAVYVGDGWGGGTIWRVDPDTGAVTRFAGGSWGYAGGSGENASFTKMRGLTFGRDGNFYVVDRTQGGAAPIVRKITPEGVVSTIAGNPHLGDAGRMVVDGPARTTARFNALWGIAADSDGNVFVVDNAGDGMNSVIRKIWFNPSIIPFDN